MKTNWKELVSQHDKLAESGRATIYDRIKLLSQVFDDPGFKRDILKEGKSPTDYLDTRVNDTCANFTELYQMMKLFPKKQQWSSGNLLQMRQQVFEHIKSKQKEQKKDTKKKTKHTVTTHQYHELEQEIKLLRQENQMLRKENERLVRVIEGMGARKAG